MFDEIVDHIYLFISYHIYFLSWNKFYVNFQKFLWRKVDSKDSINLFSYIHHQRVNNLNITEKNPWYIREILAYAVSRIYTTSYLIIDHPYLRRITYEALHTIINENTSVEYGTTSIDALITNNNSPSITQDNQLCTHVFVYSQVLYTRCLGPGFQ